MIPNRREHLIIEYKDLQRQVRGLSPKLELHATLTKRMQMISELIGDIASPYTLSKRKLIRKKQHFLYTKKKIEEKKLLCSMPDCKNPRASNGRTKTGIQKYKTLCRVHYRKKKKNI